MVDGIAIPEPGSVSVAVGSATVTEITCNADISAKTLEVIFEAIGATTDIVVVADGSLTKSTTTVTMTIPTSVTSVERTLRATIRDTTSLESYAELRVFVTADALPDD